MYFAKQILFPNDAIPLLRDLRGPIWQQLIDRITPLADDHPEKLALVLMTIRLNNCLDCETDSFRALKGCDYCAITRLRRFKGTDEDLLNQYQKALDIIAKQAPIQFREAA